MLKISPIEPIKLEDSVKLIPEIEDLYINDSVVLKDKRWSKTGIDKKTGIKFDSIAEFAFFIANTEVYGFQVVRNTEKSFEYVRPNGKKGNFYPDFIVNGKFYEIKGRFTLVDQAKREATLGQVEFFDMERMKDIYKDLKEKMPNWRKRFREVVADGPGGRSWKHNYGQEKNKTIL